MSDQMPPARRRPSSGGASPGGRPPARRTGVQRTALARPALDPEPRAEVRARLVCTAGPKAGTEFPLMGDDIIVGRATENAVSIPDTSVSRRHCSIRRTNGSWVISDLGSGNGTILNGERIEAEAVLGNGDVITIGDTELRFEDEENATEPRALPARRGLDGAPPLRRSVAGRPDVRARLSRSGAPAADPAKRRKVLIIGGAALVVVVGGLIGLKVMADRKQQRELEELAQQQRIRQELSAIFQEGKNLVREGKWIEAKAKFEQVQQRNPNYPAVGDYLNRASIEIPNAEHLAQAAEALAGNRLADAAAELQQVSNDTQQFEKLRELKAKLDQQLEHRLVEAAQLMNTPGDRDARRAAYVKAKEITDDILKMSPDHRDAQAINKNAIEQIRLIDAPAPVAVGPKPKPWEPAVARYVDGDMTGALAMADECAGKDKKCRDLAKDIREFASLYKKVEELDARGLWRLLGLDKDITGGPRSKMARTAGTRAATLFYKNASAAKNAGQWGKAIEWAQKALSADPDHQGAKAIVAEVRGKAHDEYLRCYALKDTSPDEAVSCFHGVLQMTSPGDTDYEKADSWIKKLETR